MDNTNFIKSLIRFRLKPTDLIYSLIFNFKLFPFKTAIKIPIFIKFGVKYKNCHKGSIILTGDIYTGMVRLGLQDNPNAKKSNSIIILGNNSKLYLGSNLSIASGIKIFTGENAEIHFGNDGYCNANLSIQCNQMIHIGNDAFIGWDVSIRDTDGHPIFENGI